MAATAQQPRRTHVPERTCVICRQKAAKRRLVRVVRTPGGRVHVDPTGKADGRGAYLCAARACWTAALKGGRLAGALRTVLPDEDRSALAAYAAGLPQNGETAADDD